MNKSLLEGVMQILATGESPEISTADVMPESPNHSIKEVRLGANKEILAEVRRHLQELENELTADARERLRVLKEEEKAEMDVYEQGDRDIEAMMADGLSREQIIDARSTASVALEMAQLKQKEIDDCEDEIARIKKAWGQKRDRLNATLYNFEVSTRAWLLDLISGTNANRLNPERPVRAYGQLLHAERLATEILGEELGARVIRRLGSLTVPDNVWETLFQVMPERYHNQDFDEADHPEAVLKRLDDTITGEQKDG